MDCNADLNHPCDADDGDPCRSCQAEHAYQFAQFNKQYKGEPKTKEELDQELIDAGRGHLVFDHFVRNK